MVGVSAIELLVLMFFGLGFGVPMGVPPGPEDPLMAQVAPSDVLFYTCWSPTVAPRAENNPTERWMANDELQSSFRKLKAAATQYLNSGPQEERAFAILALELSEKLLSNSAAMYCSKLEFDDGLTNIEGAFIVDLGDEAPSFETRITAALAAVFELESEAIRIDNQSFRTAKLADLELDLTLTWGIVKQRYFAVTFGDGEMKRLLENLETPAPLWRTNLRQRIPVERVASVSYLDFARISQLITANPIPEINRLFELVEFEQIQNVGWISGLDAKGYTMRAAITLDGQPGGLLGMIDGKPLSTSDLARIPDDKMFVVASRLSPEKAYDFVKEFSKISFGALDPSITELNRLADINFQEDVIQNLGDYVYLYGSINMTNPMGGWTLVIGPGNEMGLSVPFDNVTELIKRQAEDDQNPIEIEEQRIKENTAYTLKSNQGLGVPQPSWALANGELVLTLDKTSMRRHLRRQPADDDRLTNDPWFQQVFQSPANSPGPVALISIDMAQVLKLVLPLVSTFGGELIPKDFEFQLNDLPSIEALTQGVKPNLVAIYRTPEGFEIVNRQIIPGGSPGDVLGAGLWLGVPMTLEVRRAASRTSSMNNLRQLALAMHNYESALRSLPARYSKDAKDRPLLSWRVHLLPYLEHKNLYEEFHLDEPWDSEHNKKLIAKMPDLFQHPRLKLEPGKTVYLAPAGPDSPFAEPTKSDTNPQGTKIEDIKDGTSQTIMILESNPDSAVIWTQPEDYNWEDRQDILEGLTGNWPSGILFALCDGSVHTANPDNLADKIKLLMQKSDGQVIDDWR